MVGRGRGPSLDVLLNPRRFADLVLAWQGAPGPLGGRLARRERVVDRHGRDAGVGLPEQDEKGPPARRVAPWAVKSHVAVLNTG